ncbi:RNA polymerase sigma factor SigJ [Plantactinospora sp. S1510]|uniref:RNA polymerase sigma factor SigJ n=1 Tax=Plantactinospora alkalitolerans TaxID=2789879 RepID=A0ABS0H692_9ACTN|nr:RNA polymerase sigma factor SigJ [Plantactinospora alkalitolerans]MBF9133987.1 RNA polymerase sigma factor SigJ [Plantactinospora alkalitolerans]
MASEFEAERDHLMAVAYRMLGSRTEAEDAVQETWLRYAAALTTPQARAEVRDLRAWLTTTTARISLDVLRSARVRREAYHGQWLPEPVVSRLPGPAGALPGGPDGFAPDPAERAAHVDQVGIALLTLLERLSPEQRVAFVLHDVFAVPFAEIATVLGTAPAAARQLASRARRAVADGSPRRPADPVEHQRLLTAFLDAAESGELDRLLEVLAPDVVLVGDGGGLFPTSRHPIVGAVKVARFALGLFRQASQEARNLRIVPVLVNGSLGLQIEAEYRPGMPLRGVMWFVAEQGRLTRLYHQVNPMKLVRVPQLAPGEQSWPIGAPRAG